MKFILIFLIITLFFPHAFASEPILITKSDGMNNVEFDGKWTTKQEWKKSSWNEFSFGDKKIHLRSAHQGNFIYFLIDPVDDLTLDNGADKATICIDSKNNKSFTPDSDDFCFSIALGNNQGIVFQGGTDLKNKNYMKRILNVDNFTAVSKISDANDRYSSIPHPSFEFKIPLELIGRSDNYGFYFSVYDANENQFSSYPVEAEREKLSSFPSPKLWGNLISPDKSLPELNLPILVFTSLIFTIILIQSKVRVGIFRE